MASVKHEKPGLPLELEASTKRKKTESEEPTGSHVYKSLFCLDSEQ